MTNEVIQNPAQKTKRNGNGMNIKKMSAKAKRNLLAQQSEYMRQTGQFIRLDLLAGRLLETATLPKPE